MRPFDLLLRKLRPETPCGNQRAPGEFRPAVDRMIQGGAVPTTAQHFVYELQQDWGRQETYQGVMDIAGCDSAFPFTG